MPTDVSLPGSVPATRSVTGEDVRKALENGVNPFTGRPHSERYRTLLKSRMELPLYAQMDEFYEMFNKNQVIIVAGETGCGKTTQIPQFVTYLDLPHTKGQLVACTQPRRLATMSVAKRVAQEMDVKLGAHVGYSIRFEDKTTPGTTFLKYLTDGILLREAMTDPELKQYSTIILDEVHERTLATDILMSLLKALVKTRTDLKVIIMSATADIRKLQKFWKLSSRHEASIFSVSDRNFPIEVFYTQEPEPDYVEAAIRTTLMIHRAEDPGDILVFLTGENEIEEVCRRLRIEAAELQQADPDAVGPLICIPLYASLPPEVQEKIYETPQPASMPEGPPNRKVIVATNIAETSLTIDGIVYVVDSGFSKQAVYNPRIRVNSHLVSPISKASAHQRAGRAGRTGPGKCFRLYTEKDFVGELEEQTPPEILRSNLSGMVLTLVVLGVTDLVRFDHFDAPAPETLMRALELLNYLAALDDEGNPTQLGKIMSAFPLEPQLAKLLIVSPKFKCSNEILTICAMLSVPHVWRRPKWEQKEADAAKALFTVPGSDHLTLLNVYNQYVENIQDKNWANSRYLSWHALSQAKKAREQLQKIMERFEIELVGTTDPERKASRVKQALVCGFFMQVAHRVRGTNDYLIVKDNQLVTTHPSYGGITKPEWVVFNEFILTNRAYIRTVSEVQPEWLLEYASTYFDLSTFPEGDTKEALRKVLRRPTVTVMPPPLNRHTQTTVNDIQEWLRVMNV